MPQTLDQNEYIVNDAQLPNLGLPVRSPDDTAMARIDMSLDAPLLMRATFPVADSTLNFEPSEVQNPDGSGRATPAIKSSIPIIPTTSIDFQAQTVTGGTVLIGWPASTVGGYRRVGFTLMPGNQIQATFSPEALTFGALADAGTLFLKGGTALGWVDLQATDVLGKFKTADSLTNVLENRNAAGLRIHRFGAGTGSGEGSGGETATHFPADGFQACQYDIFDVAPTNAESKINPLLTTATYNNGKLLYQISCDKSPALSTVGTAFTLSAAPGFTIKKGDILWSGGAWRAIASISSQTVGVLDAAFPVNLTAAAGMVSQAVWTIDLANAGDPLQLDRLRDLFPGVDYTLTNLSYGDSLDVGDDEADRTVAARVVGAAANIGLITDVTLPLSSDFAPTFTREAVVAASGIFPQEANYPVGAAVAGQAQRLFLVFFANPLEAAVTTTANLLNYDLSIGPDELLQSGGVLWSFQCHTDGTGSNGLLIDNTGPVSVVTLPPGYHFVPGINTNPVMADGDFVPELDGRPLPRYYLGIKTGYWKEIIGSTNSFELHGNVAALDVSIKAVKRQGSIDASPQNKLAIAAIRDLVVGTVAQVASGLAQYSSLQAAHDFLPAGSKIQLIGQPTDTTLSWTKASMIVESRGFGVLLNAALTLAVGANYNVFKYVKFGQAVTLNSNGNHITDCWKPFAAAFVNSGSENVYTLARY